MSIESFSIEEIVQPIQVPDERKIKYGEVITPHSFVRTMIEMIPSDILCNPNMLWVDPACGPGAFPCVLYHTLMKTLASSVPDISMRKQYIQEKMLYLNELNQEHREKLSTMFPKTRINFEDFLLIRTIPRIDNQRVCIIGNPPYNARGLIKPPTGKATSKKQDGSAVWKPFIVRALDLMQYGDLLLFIVPSLWMRKDRAKIYSTILRYKIHSVRCFTNTETNRIFRGHAQTPTSIFLLEKIPNDFVVSLYNSHISSYKPFTYYEGEPIPLCGSSIISKLKPFVYKYNNVGVSKTNMPLARIQLQDVCDATFAYPNVHTCHLCEKVTPTLIIKYSNEPCKYYGTKKLILAHKMYGFPYFDNTGHYGISNRDNYVVTGDYTDEQYKILQHYLSSKLVMFVFETTRYRMKYLEKYAFEFIPNILHIPSTYHASSTDSELYTLFGLENEDIKYIETFHKKKYNFFN